MRVFQIGQTSTGEPSGSALKGRYRRLLRWIPRASVPLLIFTISLACSRTHKLSDYVGTWQFEKVDRPGGKPVPKEITGILSNQVIVLNPDMTYSETFGKDLPKGTGEWKLKDAELTLSPLVAAGSVVDNTIHLGTLSPDSQTLSLKTENSKGTALIFKRTSN